MKSADRMASLLLVAICGYAWFQARSFSPLSAFFPRVIIVVLAGLSLLLFVLSFARSGREERFVLVKGNILPVALAVLLMASWTVLISLLGFLVTSLLMFSLMSVVLERRKRGPLQILLRIGVVSAVTVAFYLFFDRLLLVSFPRGVLL